MRTWLDTIVATHYDMDSIERLIQEGHVLVVANTAVDVAVFQQNPEWFEEKLQKQQIVVENWLTPDAMVQKPFYWSSCSQETAPSDTLAEAVAGLSNAEGIMKVASLVNQYGIPKGSWPMGDWAPPTPISAELAEVLGVDPATATRTEIMSAAIETGHMDEFNAYNTEYCRGLATQHTCEGILNIDGSVSPL